MKTSIPTALLQFGRFIAGLVAIWQIVGLLPLFTWLSDLSSVTTYMAIVATIKGVVLALSALVYVFLTKRVSPRKGSPLQATEAAPPKEGNPEPKLSPRIRPPAPDQDTRDPMTKAIAPEVPAVASSDAPTPVDELLWAEAAEELAGPSRRPGLWARLFSEAKGDSNVAKASYLSHRFSELKEQQRKEDAKRRAAAAVVLREAAAERLAREAKAFAHLPNWAKGTCPYCEVLLLSSATRCQTCGASSDNDPGWEPRPLSVP